MLLTPLSSPLQRSTENPHGPGIFGGRRGLWATRFRSLWRFQEPIDVRRDGKTAVKHLREQQMHSSEPRTMDSSS